MTALQDFIRAAASYYGVPPDQLTEGSTLDASRGDIEVVLRIALTAEDVAGIAGCMQHMARERKAEEAQAADKKAVIEHALRVEQTREKYNALSAAERSSFGSFARFCAGLPISALFEMAKTERTDKGSTGPVVSKAELPAHVYLPPDAVGEQQAAMAVGRDARGWYAVDPDDLTEEQALALARGEYERTGGLPG